MAFVVACVRLPPSRDTGSVGAAAACVVMPEAFARIHAQWDPSQVRTAFAALEPRQWQFATALALSRTGRQVKDAEVAEMRSVFDRPTPYTLNSLRLQPASRQQLEARVWFREFSGKGTVAADYLLPQVYGDTRKAKRFERRLQTVGLLQGRRYLVPASGAPLDAYGNVQRGIYARVLSQLQAQFNPQSNQTAGSRGRRRRRRVRGGEFFYGNPGRRGRGIWERFAFAFGSAVRPVFLERGRVSYRPRFAFFDVADRVAAKSFGPEFDRAAAQALATARR
jgi:hypothetical protein